MNPEGDSPQGGPPFFCFRSLNVLRATQFYQRAHRLPAGQQALAEGRGLLRGIRRDHRPPGYQPSAPATAILHGPGEKRHGHPPGGHELPPGLQLAVQPRELPVHAREHHVRHHGQQHSVPGRGHEAPDQLHPEEPLGHDLPGVPAHQRERLRAHLLGADQQRLHERDADRLHL